MWTWRRFQMVYQHSYQQSLHVWREWCKDTIPRSAMPISQYINNSCRWLIGTGAAGDMNQPFHQNHHQTVSMMMVILLISVINMTMTTPYWCTRWSWVKDSTHSCHITSTQANLSTTNELDLYILDLGFCKSILALPETLQDVEKITSQCLPSLWSVQSFINCWSLVDTSNYLQWSSSGKGQQQLQPLSYP